MRRKIYAPNRYWFKRYGLNWQPVTWEGCAVLMGFIVGFISLVVWFTWRIPPAFLDVVALFVGAFLLIGGLIAVSVWKCDPPIE